MTVPLTWFAIHIALVAAATRLPGVRASTYAQLTHTGLDPLLQWDAVWYALIGQYGYNIPLGAQLILGKGGNHIPLSPLQSAAFFPLLPLLIHAFGVTGGFVLSNLALFAALVVMYRLLRQVASPAASRVVLGLCAINPATVFDSALYSDVYAILFSLLALYAVGRSVADGDAAPTPAAGSQRRFYLLACVSALIVGLDHELGAAVIVFALRYLRHRQYRRTVVYALCSIAGWAAYAAYLGIRFHRPLAMFQAEHSWHHSWAFPGYNIFAAFTKVSVSPFLPISALLLAVLAVLFVARVVVFDHTWTSQQPLTIASLESGLWVAAWAFAALISYIPYDPVSGVIRLLAVPWPAFSVVALSVADRAGVLPLGRDRGASLSAPPGTGRVSLPARVVRDAVVVVFAFLALVFAVWFTHGYAVL